MGDVDETDEEPEAGPDAEQLAELEAKGDNIGDADENGDAEEKDAFENGDCSPE